MGFADLHIHTIYSYNGFASVPDVLARAQEVGLHVIAVTDHDEIKGALQAFDLAPRFGIEVIPGIEISTSEGDLLALFITEKIKPGSPLIETLLKVGEAGGICIAPHPMARGRGRKSLSLPSILWALQHPEASRILMGIETYNATLPDPASNEDARLLTTRFPCVAQVGNSDAHVLQDIGSGITKFPGRTAADLLDAIWIGATDVGQRDAQLMYSPVQPRTSAAGHSVLGNEHPPIICVERNSTWN